MHTEVDVPNPDRVLMPGLYAEADVALEHRDDIPSVPLQAINHEGDKTTVFRREAVTAKSRTAPVTLGYRRPPMPRSFPG